MHCRTSPWGGLSTFQGSFIGGDNWKVTPGFSRGLSPQASLPFAEFNLFSFSVITMCVTAFLSPVSPFSQIVKPEGGLGDPNTTRRCMILFI